MNTADWLGFHESRLGKDYADFQQLKYCFLYVFIVTLMRVVEIRIRNYRISRGLPLKSADVIFTDITYENCHENTGNMFKYLANYGFYKFGCEVFNLHSIRCVTFKTIFFIDNGNIRDDFDERQDGRGCHIDVV